MLRAEWEPVDVTRVDGGIPFAYAPAVSDVGTYPGTHCEFARVHGAGTGNLSRQVRCA